MLRVIYKYVISGMQCQLTLPRGADILSAHNQSDQVCLWVAVDPYETEVECREIVLLPTGDQISHEDYELSEFIGTVLVSDGDLVFHVFESLNGGF